MGGTTSKTVPAGPPNLFKTDPNAATYSGTYVEAELARASAVAREIQKKSQSAGLWVFGLTGLSGILFMAGVAVLIYYLLARFGVVSSFFGFVINPGTGAASKVGATRNLIIHSATQNGKDVTPAVGVLVVGDTLAIAPSISSSIGADGPTSGTALPNPVVLTYQFSDDTVTYTYPITDDTQSVTISPTSNPGKASGKSTAPPGQQATAPTSSPGFFGSLFAGNGGSGTLVSSMLDATNSSVVKATSAPLSGGSSGAYGMQWWMFIKDWNYGYGKDKQILSRADPTNLQVLNPSVALHPTDNTMRITVSVFPDETGSSSKTQPAPAGHSGSTDDVFICEVPNLPLQDWFSVSMTVFGRNLDVYIDGKLVKSCLLPGVPKPASGDITMAGNGGFSGSLCNFNHYSRMLVPDDAVSFYSAGTSCKSSTGPSTASAATGYAVKFGVYDTVGKKIQEYTF